MLKVSLQLVALLEDGGTYRKRDLVKGSWVILGKPWKGMWDLQSFPGTLSLFSVLLFAPWLPWITALFAVSHIHHHYGMSHCRPKSNKVSWLWAKTSDTVSQKNKSSLTLLLPLPLLLVQHHCCHLFSFLYVTLSACSANYEDQK
jgi:hypothetical protein